MIFDQNEFSRGSPRAVEGGEPVAQPDGGWSPGYR